MTKEKQTGIPFFVQILAILLAGALVSVALFFGLRALRNPGNAGKADENQVHTVTFAYSDGELIETRQVTHGKGVIPPAPEDKGVFRGWNIPLNNITADAEAHPEYHYIEEDNLFYFDTVYVREGEEFTLKVKLDGRVNVSGGTLILSYDPEVLTFRKGDGLCKVEETEKGTVRLQFDSETPITEATLLSTLQFRTKKKDVFSSQINLGTENVKIVTGGEEAPADHATINNKVYFLQEVEG